MVTNVQAYNYAGTQASQQFPNFAPAMSNDFFGSQIFGGAGYNQQQPTYAPPTNAASAILQQHMYETNATQGVNNNPPTMEDYAMATQIANMYSGANTPSLFTNSYFMQNDIFAQQVFPPFTMNNGQAIA